MLCQETNLPQQGPLLNLSFDWPDFIPFTMPSPLFGSVECPEMETEFKLSALIQQFHGFVVAKLLEIIKNTGVIVVEFAVSVVGITIDVFKFFTDNEYIASLRQTLKENISAIWDALPDFSKFFDGGNGFECPDFQLEVAWNYIVTFVNKNIIEKLLSAITAVMEYIEDAFETTAPSLGFNFDIAQEFQNIVDAITSIFEGDMSIGDKINALLGISLFGFNFSSIFGESQPGSLDFPEMIMMRISTTLANFVLAFLKSVLLEKIEAIMSFLTLIPALGALLDFLIMSFCDFLGLIGFDV